MDRRRTDRAVKRLAVAFVTLAVGVTAVAVVLVVQLGAQRRESRERISSTCVSFEREESKAIDQLRQTYAFIVHPPPGTEALRPLALGQVAKAEQDAKAARAPRYCDPPGVGLKGPRPKIPPRPAVLAPKVRPYARGGPRVF